jgi:uncharacterized protein (TIGR02001 family)
MTIRATAARRARASACAAWPLIALCCAACSPQAHAGQWQGSVAAVSDYMFRGVSQTYGDPALQAGLAWRGDAGWFAGAWGSSVWPYPFYSHAVEADLYAGYSLALSPRWNARATYTRYTYLSDPRPVPYDYGEFSASIGYEDRIMATLSWQPDGTQITALGYAHGRQLLAYELSSRWPLAANWSLGLSAGYYDLDHMFGLGYLSGSAGVTYHRGHLQLGVMYCDADGNARRLYEEAAAHRHWVATAMWRF